MNAIGEVARPETTEIIALVEATPVIVLTDKKKYSAFFNAMKAECDAHVPDLSTETGRKKIASLAYKVARTKTAIDDAGKKLNEEARARINAIDESRREIRQQLDTLKDEVRKPLSEWEAAEERREESSKAELQSIRDMGRVDFDDTAETVGEKIKQLSAMVIDADLHKELAGVVDAAKAQALGSLNDAHARLLREEQERAELERLRAEAAERERLEAEKREKEESERRRAAAEKAEHDRIAALQRQAEERARAEAEQKAKEEREATERAHAEALATERRRAEEAERAAQADRDRIAREEAERAAAAQREADEQARRDADRAHRSKVMTAAKEAIMEAGEVDEAAAKRIVLAIAAGNVPSINIRF